MVPLQARIYAGSMASGVYADRMGWAAVAAVTAPPLVLAGLGLTHPDDLTGVSAGWWTSLHIILVPLFPLLGVSHWILLHGRPGVIVGSAGSQPSSNARLETLLGNSTSGTSCLRRPSVAMGR